MATIIIGTFTLRPKKLRPVPHTVRGPVDTQKCCATGESEPMQQIAHRAVGG